jgi:putative transposase
MEINGESDHIHFLLDCPPSSPVSTAVARIKVISARMFLRRDGSQFWGKHRRTLWNSGYFSASPGGATLEVLRQYVESQGRA